MWDSAKKPIKIRSVLQSNGMRHYVVNEETEQVYSNILLQQQQQNKKRNGRRLSTTNLSENMQNNDNHRLESNSNVDSKEGDEASCDKKSEKKPYPLNRSNSQILTEPEGKVFFHDSCDDFFGVAGSRIYNGKKHKGQYNRYFPHYIKDATLAQLNKDSILNKCPHLKEEALDFIPVKSPVIKKLINGGSSAGKLDFNKPSGKKESSATSTTLCSRIMTWIDLEVKRNAVKGKPSGSLSFSSADLNIVNEVNDFDSTSTTSSANSGSSSPSGESFGSSSSGTSLPKLVPCWRKNKGLSTIDGNENKMKKSVRISDDLPRWGKMKRRLGKTERSSSLNELFNDDELSPSMFPPDLLESNYKSGGRKSISSKIACDYGKTTQGKVDIHYRNQPNSQVEQVDSYFVCDDEHEPSSGKVQVHIFLPQTDNSTTSGKMVEGRTGDNESNFSGRSEDSTA